MTPEQEPQAVLGGEQASSSPEKWYPSMGTAAIDELNPAPITPPGRVDDPLTAADIVDYPSPAHPLPPLVDTEGACLRAAAALRAGHGDFAVDTERAGMYRYDGRRAYLIQVRRAGAGTFLIDPERCPDLEPIAEVMNSAPWIIHDASADLPCLADVGMVPPRIYDTLVAAYLLGYPRPNLGDLCRSILGLSLAKKYTMADWSQRPLPDPWLTYAALDVEFLLPLRDALWGELADRGRDAWADQECEHILHQPEPEEPADPWRKHLPVQKMRTRRQYAMARELWLARDAIASSLDRSPHRVLENKAISEAVLVQPTSKRQLMNLPTFTDRGTRRNINDWWEALTVARMLPENELPPIHPAHDGPHRPAVFRWNKLNPAAHACLTAMKGAAAAVAKDLGLRGGAELLDKTASTNTAWYFGQLLAGDNPEPGGGDSPTTPHPGDVSMITVESVDEQLRLHGARPWQRELIRQPVTEALAAAVDEVREQLAKEQSAQAQQASDAGTGAAPAGKPAAAKPAAAKPASAKPAKRRRRR